MLSPGEKNLSFSLVKNHNNFLPRVLIPALVTQYIHKTYIKIFYTRDDWNFSSIFSFFKAIVKNVLFICYLLFSKQYHYSAFIQAIQGYLAYQELEDHQAMKDYQDYQVQREIQDNLDFLDHQEEMDSRGPKEIVDFQVSQD